MEPGDRINRYTIVSEIGGGGMCEVYLADDQTTNTRVVVKQLREQYVFDRQLVDRFLRGATAVQDLRHPHLVRVLERLEQNGRFYVVEEYLPGGSLADLLKNSGPPTQTEALIWCRDALRALNYVHEFGIVHRDIKPSNLMLDGNRQIRVIDFGIARVFGDRRLTRTGDGAIGTAWYMSPEQIRTEEVDHLTDVYAAGVVLYELLTGSVPFDGPTDFSVKEKIIHQAPPPMATLRPGIDPALEKIVFKAMAKDPKQRYGGCGEFALAIERYVKERSSERKTWAGATATWIVSPVRRAPRVATGLLVLVVVLGGGAGIGLRPFGWRAALPSASVSSSAAVTPPTVTPPPAVTPPAVTPPPAVRPTAAPPTIRLMTRVEPESVSQAGTNVTFRYELTNGGSEPLKNVTIVDGGPTPPVLVSGDANGNGALDADETWQFQSQTTIEQQHLDGGRVLRHVVARSDGAAYDARDLEVHLQRRPGIAISTLVNGAKSVQVNAPGPVSCTYMVTNTGNVRLTGINVRDEQGATPRLSGGDSNGNRALDVGERWEYRSTATITPAEFASGEPVVRRAFAISDQSRSGPDEVTIRFDRPAAPLRPGGTVPTPRKVHDVPPQYPPEAAAAGVQGEVLIDVTINAIGRVEGVQVVQSTAASAAGPAPQTLRTLLEIAAMAAARQWEYAPTLVKGVPVRIIATANIRFVLTPKPPATPQAPPAPVRVGGNIKTPAKTKHVDPVYPTDAAAASVQGQVVVEATIDASGRIADARVLRSVPLLDQAALDAIRQWEYAPTILNGVPVPVILTITVSFTLK